MITHVTKSTQDKPYPISRLFSALEEIIKQGNVEHIAQRFYFKSKQDVQEYPEASLWYQLYLALSLRGFKDKIVHESEYELDEKGVLTISRYFSIVRSTYFEPEFDTRFRHFLHLQSTLLSLTNQFDHLILSRPK